MGVDETVGHSGEGERHKHSQIANDLVMGSFLNRSKERRLAALIWEDMGTFGTATECLAKSSKRQFH